MGFVYFIVALAVLCVLLKVYYLLKLAQQRNYQAFWKTLLIIFTGLMYFPILRKATNEEEAVLIRKANISILFFWIFFFIVTLSALFFI
jgi:hypothetical protein